MSIAKHRPPHNHIDLTLKNRIHKQHTNKDHSISSIHPTSCSVVAIERTSLEKALGFDNCEPHKLSKSAILEEIKGRLRNFPLLVGSGLAYTDYIDELAVDMSMTRCLPGEQIIQKGEKGCVNM